MRTVYCTRDFLSHDLSVRFCVGMCVCVCVFHVNLCVSGVCVLCSVVIRFVAPSEIRAVHLSDDVQSNTIRYNQIWWVGGGGWWGAARSLKAICFQPPQLMCGVVACVCVCVSGGNVYNGQLPRPDGR